MASAVAQRAEERFGLQGKNALVTGGTQGIGRAAVEELARLGANVFTCARSQETLDAVISAFAADGLKVQGCVADVSKAEDRQALVQTISELFQGRLDILINNVGTNIRKFGTEKFSSEDFNFLIRTNLESAFNLCQLTQPLLKASGSGVILFNSSVAGGPLAMKSGAIYAMTKASMNQLTKNLACEWAKDNIRVNSVSPWYTATDLAQQVLQDQEYNAGVLSRTPMGRIAQVDEVSGLMAFLCSRAASYITGQVIAVDGGYSVMGFM